VSCMLVPGMVYILENLVLLKGCILGVEWGFLSYLGREGSSSNYCCCALLLLLLQALMSLEDGAIS
jgi:hypothetical protein